jgi:hypothetical protein
LIHCRGIKNQKWGGWIFSRPMRGREAGHSGGFGLAHWKIKVGLFGSQSNSKFNKRRRLDFFAANRTANIKKRRRLDFLSANHRAQNDKLKKLDFFEASDNERCICVHTETYSRLQFIPCSCIPSVLQLFMHILLRPKNAPIVCRLNMMIV